ncbi:hypothetical protein [Acinetobacter qingfengensis]|nr:hypothetical protein [Acinetobacter qingfengensis]
MWSKQPQQDPQELNPKEKTKRVRYITTAIILFFLIVLVFMLFNM